MHCLTLYWGPLPLAVVERRSREALAEAERSGVSSLAATAYRVLARVAAHRRPGRGQAVRGRGHRHHQGGGLAAAQGGGLHLAGDGRHAGRRPGRRRGGPARRLPPAGGDGRHRAPGQRGRAAGPGPLRGAATRTPRSSPHRAAGRPRPGRRPGQVAVHPGHRRRPPGRLGDAERLARRPSTWPARPTSSTRGPRPTSTWPRSCSWVAAAARPSTSWSGPSPCSRRRATRSGSATPCGCWPGPAAEGLASACGRRQDSDRQIRRSVSQLGLARVARA